MSARPAKDHHATNRPGRVRQLLIWVVLVLSAAMTVFAIVVGVSARPGNQPIVVQGPIAYISGAVITLAFGFVFAVLARQRPDNRVGWLYGAVTLLSSVANATWGYVTNATETIPPRLPAPEVVGWIGGMTLPIWSYLLFLHILIFPDGRPLSPAWGRWAGVVGALAAVGIISIAFAAGPVPNYLVDNPFAAPGAIGDALAVLAGAILVLQVLLVIPSLWALALRYRRADRTGRLQLKWFIFAAAVLAVVGFFFVLVRDLAFTRGSTIGDITWVAFSAAAILTPIAALIAIQRHGLYQIDRIINRTFVYGALTAILAGVYTAGIRLLNWVFVELTGETSDLPLVLTTLVLATTFTPIKGRLEKFAAERLREPDEAQPADGPFAALDMDDPKVQAFAARVAEVVREQLKASGGTAKGRRTRSTAGPMTALDSSKEVPDG